MIEKKKKFGIVGVLLLLLFVFLFAAAMGYKIVTKNSNKNVISNDLVPQPAGQFQQEAQMVKEQVDQQINGYPLLVNPFSNAYQLEGKLSDIIVEEVRLGENFLVKALASFNYLDSGGTAQSIKVPLVVENTTTNETVYYAQGLTLKLSSPAEIQTYLVETLGYPNNYGKTVRLTIGMPKDLTELSVEENSIRSLIEFMYPSGFEKFSKDGSNDSLGSNQEWLIPLTMTVL